MSQRYWLVLPNGGRQLIDPARFDLASVEERARRIGGQLVVESAELGVLQAVPHVPRAFEPPISALGPLFRVRLGRVFECRVPYLLDINMRATVRVLGGYYKRTRLVRVYSHDRVTGRRPLEELFDTFLHEIAHHIEYTEPQTFRARACGRVPGRMHSALFWRIFGDLKHRWADAQAAQRASAADMGDR
jgi:hypothetical protein